MRLRMVTLKEAQIFTEQNHRHLKSPFIHKFSVGLEDNEKNLIGVAMVEMPKARNSNDGETLEITRLTTLGSKNACSMLYSACIRAARALGARRIITYTLETEHGASLRASGFREEGLAGGGEWNTEKRQYGNKIPLFDDGRKRQPTCKKRKWIKDL